MDWSYFSMVLEITSCWRWNFRYQNINRTLSSCPNLFLRKCKSCWPNLHRHSTKLRFSWWAISVYSSSWNRQMCCKRAEISCEDHSLERTDVCAKFVSGKKLFLEYHCTSNPLIAGLPVVFSSASVGLLEVMLLQVIVKKKERYHGVRWDAIICRFKL